MYTQKGFLRLSDEQKCCVIVYDAHRRWRRSPVPGKLDGYLHFSAVKIVSRLRGVFYTHSNNLCARYNYSDFNGTRGLARGTEKGNEAGDAAARKNKKRKHYFQPTAAAVTTFLYDTPSSCGCTVCSYSVHQGWPNLLG